MDQRALLKVLATDAPAAEPLERLLDGLTLTERAGRVGITDVSALQQCTLLYTAIDEEHGGAIAAGIATDTLRWSVELLSRSMSESTRRSLNAAVGGLADRIAWAHYDAGYSREVWRLARLALQTTSQGDDPTLQAHARGNAAHFIGEQDPADAAEALRTCLRSDRHQL